MIKTINPDRNRRMILETAAILQSMLKQRSNESSLDRFIAKVLVFNTRIIVILQ